MKKLKKIIFLITGGVFFSLAFFCLHNHNWLDLRIYRALAWGTDDWVYDYRANWVKPNTATTWLGDQPYTSQRFLDIKNANGELFQDGLLDVTLYDGFNGNSVDPTGKKDSTAGIQQAMVDARRNGYVIFFPNQSNGQRGVYLISKTLDGMMDDRETISTNFSSANDVMGSKKGGVRPLIKLKSGAADFQDSNNPQPMFWFWSRCWSSLSSQCASQTVNKPWANEYGDSFNQTLRGVDLDLGSNPGAIGVDNWGAQGATVQNVRINAEGAYAGMRNNSCLGGSDYDIEVTGGRYGFVVDTTRALDPNTQQPPGESNGQFARFGVKLINQKEAAIKIFPAQYTPVLLTGFEIKSDKAIPAVAGALSDSTGGLILIDGFIDLPNVDIYQTNTKALYMKNVYLKGINNLEETAISNPSQWTWVKEYAQPSPSYKNLINGVTSQNATVNIVENQNYSENQLIESLVNFHKWDYDSFPSFEDSNVANVKDYGAYGDNIHDDTQAVLSAMSHSNKIFFPRGIYLVSQSIVLKSDTKLFGVSKKSATIRPARSWHPDVNKQAVLLTTVDDASAKPILADIGLSINACDKNKNNTVEEYVSGGGRYNDADQFQFTPAVWRAGRDSIVKDVFFSPYSDCACQYPIPSRNISEDYECRMDYDRVEVTGHGGGRWFNVLGTGYTSFSVVPSRAGKSPVALRIKDTDEPLYMHTFNPASDSPIANIKVENSKNKYFYYPQFEPAGVSMSISDSQNIGIYGYWDNGRPAFGNDGAGVQSFNNENMVTVDINRFLDDNHARIIEKYNGSTIKLNDPIALYKRGDTEYLPISGSTPQTTSCTAFTYSDWSTCQNNTQIRTVASSSPSGCTGGSPSTTQSCAPADASNLIQNPGFDSTNNWNFYTNGQGTFANDNGQGHVTITQTGGNTQLFQYNIPIEPNHKYKLSFDAYSNTGHGLKVNLLKQDSPYTNLGFSQSFNLTANLQTYTQEFTSTNITQEPNVRLMFWFSDSAQNDDQYFIDNVKLEDLGEAPAKTYTISDFTNLTSDWMKNTPNSPADVNKDDKINTQDLGIMMSKWKK